MSREKEIRPLGTTQSDRRIAASFQPDGSPRYATAWVALSDATPDNSCLYCIPAHADPGYHAPGDVDACNDTDYTSSMPYADEAAAAPKSKVRAASAAGPTTHGATDDGAARACATTTSDDSSAAASSSDPLRRALAEKEAYQVTLHYITLH